MTVAPPGQRHRLQRAGVERVAEVLGAADDSASSDLPSSESRMAVQVRVVEAIPMLSSDAMPAGTGSAACLRALRTSTRVRPHLHDSTPTYRKHTTVHVTPTTCDGRALGAASRGRSYWFEHPTPGVVCCPKSDPQTTANHRVPARILRWSERVRHRRRAI